MAAALDYAFEPAGLRADLDATPIRVVMDRGCHEELLRFLRTDSALGRTVTRNGGLQFGRWILNLPLADADAILAQPTIWERCWRAAGPIEAALRLRRGRLVPRPAVAAALFDMQDHARRWNEARREALAAGGCFEPPVRDRRLDLAEAGRAS